MQNELHEEIVVHFEAHSELIVGQSTCPITGWEYTRWGSGVIRRVLICNALERRGWKFTMPNMAICLLKLIWRKQNLVYSSFPLQLNHKLNLT